MLTTGSFAVVPVADDAPPDAGVSVRLRDFGHHGDGVGDEIESFAAEDFGSDVAFCAGEEVVGDIFEVAAVLVPWACG